MGPKKNGYKFPDKLPYGEILEDVAKKKWFLGDSIGKGGFGEIYSAAEYSKKDFSYVIKIEPHENGPLFMEKNFYVRAAKSDDVKAWKQKHGLKTLGMPVYIGSGTHHHKECKYRFLVMERFGQDLWSLFGNYKTFPPHTVYKCALQIVDVLHYIHSKDYIHGDVKGANLLLGRKPGTENTVYVVDFGLACRYSKDKELKRDPKQAHNGTIEYTSCDMHLGVPTRRGDLEILGYNLLHWLSGSLPWEKDSAKKDIVHKKKQDLMSNVESYISKNFSDIPKVIITYMSYVSKIKHDEEPNYDYVKELFTKELKQIGSSPNGPLEFKPSKLPAVAAPSKRSSTAGTPNKRASIRKSVTRPISEVENEVPVKIPRKRPVKGKKVTKVESEEEVEISPIVPDKSSIKQKPRKQPVASPLLDSDSDDMFEPTTKGRKGRAAKTDDEFVPASPTKRSGASPARASKRLMSKRTRE